MKIIKIELNDEQAARFEVLKTRLGLGADAEVARFAINEVYTIMAKPAEAHS